MTGKETENPETGGQWTTAERLMILRRIDVAAASEQLRADLTIAQRQLLQAKEDEWEAGLLTQGVPGVPQDPLPPPCGPPGPSQDPV